MVIVAIFALASWWLLYRRERFRRLATYHSSQSLLHTTGGVARFAGHEVYTMAISARGEWHKWLAVKYGEAASHPWIPVVSDSPPPLPGQRVIPDPYDPDISESRFGYPADLYPVHEPLKTPRTPKPR